MHCRSTSALLVLSLGLVNACSSTQPSPTSPSSDIVPTSAASGSISGPTTASAPAPSRPESNYEVRFMENMIDHHAMAVMMAQMCLEKATHQDLLSLCGSIIASQSQQMQQMHAWLQSWYGISYAPQMNPGDRRMMDRLGSTSGAGFEIMFMEMMIKHHQKAVREGKQCVDKAHHPELIALCQNIVRSQSAEISEMQSWLCTWYDECTRQ